MKEQPLVSAIIPTHNRAALLPRAINSAINQTYKNIEVIIVDDGSNDETESVVRSFLQMHHNIKYIKHEVAQGACAARNRGLREAKGYFISGLDDDDEWIFNRIELMVEAYKLEYAYVCTDAVKINAEGSYIKRHKSIITLDDMLYYNATGSQVLALREDILGVDGFDPTLTSKQDADLWIRLLVLKPKALNLSRPLYIIHSEHDGPRITDKHKSLKNRLYYYSKHKKHMSRSQKKYHIFKIKKSTSNPVSICDIIKLVPSFRRRGEIKGWISERVRPK
jgi:glycosyltransferase involved in cell wall biosynthesis